MKALKVVEQNGSSSKADTDISYNNYDENHNNEKVQCSYDININTDNNEYNNRNNKNYNNKNCNNNDLIIIRVLKFMILVMIYNNDKESGSEERVILKILIFCT